MLGWDVQIGKALTVQFNKDGIGGLGEKRKENDSFRKLCGEVGVDPARRRWSIHVCHLGIE